MNTGAPTVNRGEIVSMYAGLKSNISYCNINDWNVVFINLTWVIGPGTRATKNATPIATQP